MQILIWKLAIILVYVAPDYQLTFQIRLYFFLTNLKSKWGVNNSEMETIWDAGPGADNQLEEEQVDSVNGNMSCIWWIKNKYETESLVATSHSHERVLDH